MAKKKKYLEAISRFGNNFTQTEFEIQTGIEYLDFDFFKSFLKWRQWHGIPTKITSAFRIGDGGAHGEGQAIDCILFKDWLRSEISALQQWLLATTWPFYGVGIYYDWNYIGLHVDKWENPDKRPQRWLREDGTYFYQSTKDSKFYNGSSVSRHHP